MGKKPGENFIKFSDIFIRLCCKKPCIITNAGDTLHLIVYPARGRPKSAVFSILPLSNVKEVSTVGYFVYVLWLIAPI